MESVGHSFLQGVEEALKNISNKHLGYNPSEKSEFLKKDNSSINYDAKQQSTFSAKEKVVTERQGKALTKLADDFYKTNRSNMILVLGTADIVDRLLSLNTKNRNVDRKQVISLAHEIIEGKWKDVSAVVVANTNVKFLTACVFCCVSVDCKSTSPPANRPSSATVIPSAFANDFL